MKTFKVNEKEYKAKAFDFNLMCDLEDMGLSISDMASKPMTAMRAYFALCTGKGKEYAGKEMEEHLIKGGTFDDVLNVMSEEMEKSDFFRSLIKTAETKNGQNQSKEK